MGGNIAHLLVVKIKTGHSVIAFGLFGLFFNAQCTLLIVKSHDTITLWVEHVISKDAGTGGLRISPLHELDQIVAVKNIVPQDQCTGVLAHKFFANDEGLRQAIGAGLDRILDVHSPLMAITQQFRKTWRVLRCADQQHIFDARQHKRGQRVIDHGLVIHRHQLLRDSLCHRVQASP